MTGVDSIYCYRFTDGAIEVDFTMSESNKDSKFIHRLARKFGVKFEKEKSWDGTSLMYKGNTADGMLKFEIRGVVPATCQVVKTEVALTAEEYAAEVAKLQKQMAEIPRIKVVSEIKCKGAKATAA